MPMFTVTRRRVVYEEAKIEAVSQDMAEWLAKTQGDDLSWEAPDPSAHGPQWKEIPRPPVEVFSRLPDVSEIVCTEKPERPGGGPPPGGPPGNRP